MSTVALCKSFSLFFFSPLSSCTLSPLLSELLSHALSLLCSQIKTPLSHALWSTVIDLNNGGHGFVAPVTILSLACTLPLVDGDRSRSVVLGQFEIGGCCRKLAMNGGQGTTTLTTKGEPNCFL